MVSDKLGRYGDNFDQLSSNSIWRKTETALRHFIFEMRIRYALRYLRCSITVDSWGVNIITSNEIYDAVVEVLYAVEAVDSLILHASEPVITTWYTDLGP